MSFSKKFLPDLKVMEKTYKGAKSDTEFIKLIVGNADVIMGSTESLDFLSSIEERVKEARIQQ